jgi:hypothetical protein
LSTFSDLRAASRRSGWAGSLSNKNRTSGQMSRGYVIEALSYGSESQH